jgi:hypothetical protein
MNELKKQPAPVPAKVLERQGVAAIANVVGGLFLVVLNILGGRFPVIGIILGVFTAIIGVTALASKDSGDRKPGAILTAAGILVILSRVGAHFFRPIAGTLLSIGAVGLVALGIWNGIQFIKGLRSRG